MNTEPFKPHPNLSDELNQSIVESELAGGAWLEKMAVGKTLRIQTRNTLYLLTKTADGYLLSGSAKYCPTPTKAYPHGSTWGGSMLKIMFVGIGMHLEIGIEGKGTITTSEIQTVEEV